VSERVPPSLGIDLGGTHARAALVDVAGGGVILDERKAKLAAREPAAVAELLATLVAAVDGTRAARAVGVGLAGMLRGWTGVVVNAPNLGWREVDFRALLAARLGRPVELYNDMNAIAVGEARYGAARGASDALCVFVGTGIGAGLLTDGRLYAGWQHLAGEIGHTKVSLSPAARLCGCGMRGCIEAYASGVHLAARAREELGSGRQKSRVVEIAGGVDNIHAGHIDEAARGGDPWATALWDEVTPLLGLVLANAVTLLNPSHLVMGGGVWQGAPDFARRALATLRATANRPSLEGFQVVDSTLGDDSGVLGAATLAGENPRLQPER
jgi:glucokinase